MRLRRRPRSEWCASEAKYNAKNGPRCLRTEWVRALPIFALGALIGLGILGGFIAQNFGYTQIIPFAGAVVFIGFIIIFAYAGVLATRYFRLIRRARVAGFQLCQICCYDLSDIERGGGMCPECGEEYTIHDTRRRWRVACCLYVCRRKNSG